MRRSFVIRVVQNVVLQKVAIFVKQWCLELGRTCQFQQLVVLKSPLGFGSALIWSAQQLNWESLIVATSPPFASVVMSRAFEFCLKTLFAIAEDTVRCFPLCIQINSQYLPRRPPSPAPFA